MQFMKLLKYLKYSGCNITIRLNPFHWGFNFGYYETNEIWEVDVFVITILPISIRLWIHDGEW
jgi:hypothetical protein